MKHLSGGTLEPATNQILQDTGDWELLTTKLSPKLTSTVHLGTIEEHIPIGGHLVLVSLEMPDAQVKVSTGKTGGVLHIKN